MLALIPDEGVAANSSAEEGERERGSQSVLRSVLRADYSTRGMSLVFACEAWHQYLANCIEYLVLPTSEKQDAVRSLLQDTDSTISWDAHVAVVDLVQPMSIHEID